MVLSCAVLICLLALYVSSLCPIHSEQHNPRMCVTEAALSHRAVHATSSETRFIASMTDVKPIVLI